jgi:hypothetical protein
MGVIARGADVRRHIVVASRGKYSAQKQQTKNVFPHAITLFL